MNTTVAPGRARTSTIPAQVVQRWNWRVLVRTPGQPDQIQPLANGVHTIGSDAEATVRIDSDPLVESIHIHLEAANDHVLVRNLCSRPEALVLGNGDEITIGSTAIYFERQTP